MERHGSELSNPYPQFLCGGATRIVPHGAASLSAPTPTPDGVMAESEAIGATVERLRSTVAGLEARLSVALEPEQPATAQQASNQLHGRLCGLHVELLGLEQWINRLTVRVRL